MKNFKFFPTLQEYRTYITTEIFTTPQFRDNVFYHGLIEFIIQHRAPIFFELNEDFEFSHFTQYFNFVLDRKDYYKNNFVRSMYFAHDFVHMLFRNPLRVGHMSFEEFCTILNMNEWVASNETETMTYYRIPGMREKSLEYTILYDLFILMGQSKKPTPAQMLELRRNILDGKQPNLVNELESQPGGSEVFAYLRKFKANNAAWCELWYKNFPRPANAFEAFPYEDEEIYAPLTGYETFLKHFNPDGPYNTEQNYRKNILKNVRNLVYLTGSKVPLPIHFDECEATLKSLEGEIVMRDVAEHFHETYIMRKAIGTHAKIN